LRIDTEAHNEVSGSSHNNSEEGTVPVENALASVAVKDLNSAAQWYEKVFGRPADSRSISKVAEWKFERGGGLQVYQLPERAGFGSCTLVVHSVEDQVAHLEEVGINTGQRTSNERVKILMIKDPDGNSIAFAEATDPSTAQ
jgi:predicted enzyme related to lactoylglutathione lyase